MRGNERAVKKNLSNIAWRRVLVAAGDKETLGSQTEKRYYGGTLRKSTENPCRLPDTHGFSSCALTA